jgi:hypothetical protein
MVITNGFDPGTKPDIMAYRGGAAIISTGEVNAAAVQANEFPTPVYVNATGTVAVELSGGTSPTGAGYLLVYYSIPTT